MKMIENMNRNFITNAILVLLTFLAIYETKAQNLPWYEGFKDGDCSGWTVVDDQPNNSGPSNWFVEDGVLKQNTNIYVNQNEYDVFLGTHIFVGNSSWSDYSFNALVKSTDNDGIGILFRYQDKSNYYRLILVQDTGNHGPFQRLQKRVNGTFFTLSEKIPDQAIPSGWFAVTADVLDDSIKIYLNHELLFSTVDNTYSSGAIGFLCYANTGAHFDSVSVTSERLIYDEPEQLPVEVDRFPYIQMPKLKSVQIAWRTKAKKLGTVEFGETLNYGRVVTEDSAAHKHLVTLSGLEPNTCYYYRVLDDGIVMAEGDTFRTVKPDSIDKVSLLIWGDSGLANQPQYDIATLMNRHAVDFCLHVGDVSQYSGEDYDNIFFKPYRNIVKSRCVYVCIGNHDIYADNAATYLDDFYLPHNNPDSTERYYSFNWGNVHGIALDSNIDFTPGSPQYQWFVSDLTSDMRKQTTWTFVYFHYPPYCQGWDSWAGDTRVQQYLVPLFEQHNVDMVFNGHTHDYERGYLNGIYYIITGGGGGGLDTWGRNYDHIDVTVLEHHFTRIDVYGDKLFLQAININDELIDSLTIRKGEFPPEEPDGDDHEPNNSPDQATTMSVGDTLTASFHSFSDVDWYRFHLDAMHMYYFTSIENDAGVAPDLALYFENDLQNNLLNSSVAGRNGNNNFRLAGYFALKTGNYYAKITNVGQVLGAYKIRLVGGRTMSDFMVHETDNSIRDADAQAALTSGDTLVYGVLFPVNDFDYHHFEGTAGWKCTVGTEPILDLDIRDTDTYIYLLDSEGNVLSENDDRGTENTPSGPTNNTFSELSERLPYTGSYYVKVRSFYNSVEGSSVINHSNPGTGEYGLLLTLEEATDADFFEKGPYLQNVTQTSITIMWETLYATNSKVEYGPTSDYGREVYDDQEVTIHEMALTGLNMEHTYHYRVVSDTIVSEDYTFRTAPRLETPFRFAVYGDNRTDEAIHETVVQSIISSYPDIVINVGDVVTNGDNHSEWSDEFFTPAHDLMVNTPVYVSIGNHERNAHWFWDYFSFPEPENWYSFNYGNSHFIILDSNPWIEYSPGSQQYNWFLEDIGSDDCKKADWVFVFFHHPPWSQMWDSPGYTGEADVREHLVPVLESHSVDMVFNGHTHDYERGFRNGVYYIITGGGGSALDRVVTGDWPHIDLWLSEYHHCVIDIDSKELSFKAINVDGVVLDSLFISKSGSGNLSRQSEDGKVPHEFKLYQNYPNPFNMTTKIGFDLPEACDVDIVVQDICGRKVATLMNSRCVAGKYEVIWQGRDDAGQTLPSGIYIYYLKAGKFSYFAKMLLVK